MEPTLSMHVCTFEKEQNDKLSSALCSYNIDESAGTITCQLTFPLNEYRNMSRKDAEFVYWLQQQTHLVEISFKRSWPGYTHTDAVELSSPTSAFSQISSSEVCDDLIVDFEITKGGFCV
jgi:hypothetical protein